ncbi:MAG: hypothetical protein HKL90_06375 [Elusimicrobia bacterium]|nr:hypothetical protein [Elusimicrobiota bacterium]
MAEEADPLPPEILAEYAQDCRLLLSRAREAAGAPGWASEEAPRRVVREAAHRLAGSAGLYGFDSAGALAATLEADLAAGAPSAADVRARLDALARALNAD